MFDAKTELENFKNKLDKKLKKFLEKKAVEAKKISPEAEQIMQEIKDLTLRGGKRIRAALLFNSYLAFGGKDKESVLYAAMSMELSETYLLIHDDIMDNDSLRRGGTTIHYKYRDKALKKKYSGINVKNYGITMAILAGDIACALSNEIITTSKFKPELRDKAVQELNKIYVLEGYGQTMDIESNFRKNIKENDVLSIYELKTVPYTFDGPLRIGAILAGVGDGRLKKLSRFALLLGIAFQIQDDILGMFGSEEKLGKPVTSDLKEGKKTLLIVEALKKANQKQRKIIKQNLGRKNVMTSDLNKIREIVKKTGALEKSKKLADKLVQKSIQELNQIELEKEGKRFLLGIAEYMINRDY